MELSTELSIAHYKERSRATFGFFASWFFRIEKKNLRRSEGRLAQLQNFSLFGDGQILDLLGLRVRNLFHLVQRPFLFVLADLLLLLQLVDRFQIGRAS